jgi:signal transduction histidine kinase
MRSRVLARGVRADEAVPGSGLGLSIVCDLADAYGGRIALDDSPLGGLRVTIALPAAAKAIRM